MPFAGDIIGVAFTALDGCNLLAILGVENLALGECFLDGDSGTVFCSITVSLCGLGCGVPNRAVLKARTAKTGAGVSGLSSMYDAPS